MFGRLRLQLTLWYVCALAVTLLAVGVLVYWLVARALDGQINDSLQDASQVAAEVLRQDQEQVPSGGGLGEGVSENDGESGEGEEDGEHDEYAAAFAEGLLGSTGDVFPLVLDVDGLVIANPRQLSVDELPLARALSDAGANGSHRSDADVGGNHVRMFTERVADDEGQALGFVVTLRSLEERDQDLQRLLLLLGVGGSVGLVLAAAGGLWLSRFAIRPVRRAFEREREFVADASHELRTPLTVVRANAESLLNKMSGEHRDALQDIVDEGRHMSRLIAELLTLAQADRGQFELRRGPLDLFDVVQAVERAGRHLVQEKQLGLTTSADHVTVDGDPDRLRELLLILIDNAVRYTPSGGRITIQAKRSGRQAEITVEDTGTGIEAQHLGRIFGRFYRVDKARARAEGELGLGLSIAREIVDAHGGTIEARSVPGRGTTLRIVLPIAPPQAKADERNVEPRAAGEPR